MSVAEDANTVYKEYDVVGHNVSGLSTAIAIFEARATPVGLEKSPQEKAGDHTQFTGITGLWTVGKSTLRFFYGNYPGGSVLTRSATFSCIPRTNTAEFATGATSDE